MMDSMEVLQQYMLREAMQSEVVDKELKQARELVSKVNCAKGNTLREKAQNCKVDYADLMIAQRLISSRK